MDRIYRDAVLVNVHLGEGDAATNAACEALKGLARYYLGAIAPGFQRAHFRESTRS